MYIVKSSDSSYIVHNQQGIKLFSPVPGRMDGLSHLPEVVSNLKIPGRLRRETLKYSVRGEKVDKRTLEICRFFWCLFTQAQISHFSPENT